MLTRVATDAVDNLFVRCIASTDSLAAFRRAASMVQRMASKPDREHFVHLAAALDAQRAVLQMLRTNQPRRMTRLARTRDRELRAFLASVRTRGTRS